MNLGNLLSLKSSTLLLTVIIVLSIALGGLCLWEIAVQHQLSRELLEINEESVTKLKLLEFIHNELGYGGLIHNYKNFLLRREQDYFRNFHKNYNELNRLIGRYSQLDTTQVEDESLEILGETIEKYHDNLDFIEAGDSFQDIVELDRSVAIDDTQTMNALMELEDHLIHNYEIEQQRVEDALVVATRILWISIALVPLFIISVLLFPVFIRSLTKEVHVRKQKEDRLRKTTRLLARAERVAQIGHWRINLETKKLYWSKEVYRIHGVSPDEFTPSVANGVQFYHKEDRPHVDRCVQEAIQVGKNFEFEARIVQHSGTVRHVKAQGYCELDASGKTKYMFGVVQDITEQKEQQVELKKNEAKLRAITENSHDAVLIIDPDGMIQYWNQTVKTMFGYSSGEMQGQHIQNLIHLNKVDAKTTPSCSDLIANDTSNESFSVLPAYGVRKNGTQFPIDCNLTLVKHSGEIMTVFFMRDNTIRQRTDEQLMKLATTDPLTGALNRRYFMHMANQEITRANRYGNPLSVIAADLDHFKNVNDTFGHAAGDMVLKEFVLSASSLLRNNDLLARSGGEEFLIMLPETDHEDALVVAERLKQTISKIEVPYEGTIITCTVSLGVAALNNKTKENYDAIMKRVDEALYEAKRTGRNKFVYLPAV